LSCLGSASIGKIELSYKVSGLVLTFDFSLVPRLGEFLVAGSKDGLFFAKRPVSCGEFYPMAEWGSVQNFSHFRSGG
jgi:hypothetical protein